ncbi:MAG: hypothetical protein WC761_00235 [Candidatus Paceibacterota bacterium]|jgi:hypothetical protein
MIGEFTVGQIVYTNKNDVYVYRLKDPVQDLWFPFALFCVDIPLLVLCVKEHVVHVLWEDHICMINHTHLSAVPPHKDQFIPEEYPVQIFEDGDNF